MTDEKFQRYAEYGNLYEQAEGSRQDGEGKFACQECKNLHHGRQDKAQDTDLQDNIFSEMDVSSLSASSVV